MKIMVEVLSILGIVTKEIKQGRMSMPLPAYNSSKRRLSSREISQDASRMDGHRGFTAEARKINAGGGSYGSSGSPEDRSRS